jgi:hypothetical protein
MYKAVTVGELLMETVFVNLALQVSNGYSTVTLGLSIILSRTD